MLLLFRPRPGDAEPPEPSGPPVVFRLGPPRVRWQVRPPDTA